MITKESIDSEVNSLWGSYFADAMRPNQYDSKFVSLIEDAEAASESVVLESLQPWWRIFEDSIQWLANLWGILDRLVKEGEGSPLLRSTWALVGASVAHSVAVRRLVLSGLDTPARAALRSLDEHLCACIAILYQPSLAEGFQSSQEPGEANQFWYNHLNSKRLRKALNAAERSLALDAEVSRGMREWRAEEIDVFSQAIHPSYVASVLTIGTPTASDPSVHAASVFGCASAASERTLNYACKTIWYFSRLGFLMIFEQHLGCEPLISLNKEDEMQQLVVVGRDVLAAINRKYWEHDVYPKGGAGDS